ncbi:MAG: MFS transporter [Alistipes sp.]|nr:MFS transporter [Alistipes sp.]
MDTQTQKRFAIWQWRTIIVTMLGYAFFYFVRKNFSFAMPGLAAEYGISNTSFGIVMTVVGLVYGFSRYFNGILADRMNARYHMSIGLALCALASLAFGFMPHILGVEIGKAPHILIVAFAILLMLNNIFQGSGYPPCARLLSHWIPPHELATKQSIWNTSHSIGASVLAILCGFIMANMGSDLSNSQQDVEKITRNYVTTLFKDDVKKSSEAIGKVIKVCEPERVAEGYLVDVIYTLKASPEKQDTTTYNFSNEKFFAVKEVVDKAKRENVEISTSEIAEECGIDKAQARATQAIVTRTEHTGAWQWAFWLPGLIALFGAVGLFALLRDTPKSVGLPELETAKTALDNDEGDASARRAYVRKMVYKNPIIWGLAIANFFVYVVRFSVLDWGPKFLTEACGMSYGKAGITVAAFEIMAIVGTLVAGWVTDRFFAGRAHRTCLWCTVGAGVAMGAFYLFYLNPGMAPDWALIGVLAMAGFFIYGPQALIGIAASNQATKKAAATANGLVGIFGYLSTAVSGFGIGWLADHYGWNYVFIGVIAMAVVGILIFLSLWGASRDGYQKANN